MPQHMPLMNTTSYINQVAQSLCNLLQAVLRKNLVPDLAAALEEQGNAFREAPTVRNYVELIWLTAGRQLSEIVASGVHEVPFCTREDKGERYGQRLLVEVVANVAARQVEAVWPAVRTNPKLGLCNLGSVAVLPVMPARMQFVMAALKERCEQLLCRADVVGDLWEPDYAVWFVECIRPAGVMSWAGPTAVENRWYHPLGCATKEEAEDLAAKLEAADRYPLQTEVKRVS